MCSNVFYSALCQYKKQKPLVQREILCKQELFHANCRFVHDLTWTSAVPIENMLSGADYVVM